MYSAFRRMTKKPPPRHKSSIPPLQSQSALPSQLQPATEMTVKRKWSAIALTLAKSLIVLLGLATIIEIFPLMEVVPGTEREKLQPFSIPFRIHNTGYVAFRIRRAVCVDTSVSGGAANSFNISDDMAVFNPKDPD